MRTLPPLLLLLLALLGLATLPPGVGPAQAEEGGAEEEGAEEEGGGDFYEGETTFSAKQVGDAIDKGVAWLKKRQQSSGTWGAIRFNSTYGGDKQSQDGYEAGPTALALYTLLKCKAKLNDPAVVKGFKYMEDNYYKPPSSYETSMLLLAVTATADPIKQLKKSDKQKEKLKLPGKYVTWARKLVDHLLDKRQARGWRYNYERGSSNAPPGGPEDLSSTQLAALALFAAHRVGIKVKNQVWEDILSFSLEQQEADGPEVVYTDPVDAKSKRTARARGFAYIRAHTADAEESSSTGGMTACGLANIEMARFILTDGGEKREAWDKRPDAQKVQTAIFDGLAWLDKHWSPFEDPFKRQKNVYHIYWLYALERAMDLLDLRLVGNHNWYNEMGQELLNRQLSGGQWDLGRGGANGGGGHDVLDTCFALLFLKRATKGQIPFGNVTGGTEAPPVDNR